MAISQSATIHGVFMSVFGVGTLIIGESGVGKSDLALSLIDRGHVFIADDMVEFSASDDNRLVGSSPKMLKNLLEIRGLGVLNVAALFGHQAVLKKQELSLVIQLEKPTSLLPHALTFDNLSWSLLGVTIPSFCLSLSEGRPRELLLETCVRNYQLNQKGYNANTTFLKNHHQALSITA